MGVFNAHMRVPTDVDWKVAAKGFCQSWCTGGKSPRHTQNPFLGE